MWRAELGSLDGAAVSQHPKTRVGSSQGSSVLNTPGVLTGPLEVGKIRVLDPACVSSRHGHRCVDCWAGNEATVCRFWMLEGL